ncbi:MAG: hypothetical protein Q7R39_04555 [Dehalococcoidia bacterium]|nr:hypothetical protein [Dehalococcoidia bacterium]
MDLIQVLNGLNECDCKTGLGGLEVEPISNAAVAVGLAVAFGILWKYGRRPAYSAGVQGLSAHLPRRRSRR